MTHTFRLMNSLIKYVGQGERQIYPKGASLICIYIYVQVRALLDLLYELKLKVRLRDSAFRKDTVDDKSCITHNKEFTIVLKNLP